VDGRDESGFSPLAEAIGQDQPDAVRWLLAHGADVNGRIAGGATPLFLTLGGRDPAVVRILIGAGADVDARLPSGRTALVAACGHGGEEQVLEMVNTLLAAGADPNAADALGVRPVAAAVEAGHTLVARQLRSASQGTTRLPGERPVAR
jgi:ankyrin repeat protein